METIKKVGTGLIVAVIGGLVALGINNLLTDDAPSTVEQIHNGSFKFTNAKTVDGHVAFDFAAVSEVSTPAVVHIKTTIGAPEVSEAPRGQNPFEEFFGEGFGFEMPRRGPQQASGSGVIFSHDGYIVTNNHVVANADKVEVVLNDKRSFIASVVGVDPSTDLAVLKVEEENLPFLSFGNSNDVKVGEWVVAVGNPFNLTSTVTAGIVSAKGRNIDLLRTRDNQYAIENFIQTDAAVNPGNSGGALVNTSGQLIGINTAIASKTGSYAGYSFAVPVNIAKKVIQDLLKYGEVKRALLGVQIGDVNATLAEEKNLPNLKGVYVGGVMEDGAGEKAGIKPDDVILKIDDKEVNSSSQLQEVVGNYHPGDKIEVVVRRGNTEKTLEAVLQSKSGDTKITNTEKKVHNASRGIQFQTLTKEEKEKYNVKSGVKITDVDKGPFKEASVKEGTVITTLDKVTIYSVAQLKKLLDSKSGAVLIEGKKPNGEDLTLGLNLGK